MKYYNTLRKYGEKINELDRYIYKCLLFQLEAGKLGVRRSKLFFLPLLSCTCAFTEKFCGIYMKTALQVF